MKIYSLGYAFFAVLLLFMSGCSSTSPYCALPKAESEEDETTIVIYRPHAVYGIFYSTPFSINGCRVNDLPNNSYHVYKLPAGQYKIVAEEQMFADGGSGEVTGVFEKSKTYYIHYSMTAGDFIGAPGVYVFETDTHIAIVPQDYAYSVMPELAEKKI